MPLSDLTFGASEREAVLRVLESRWISTGPEVAAFESEFAASCDVAHAVAVSSATAALHLSLIAIGTTAGDEIVQPALNFVATANMTRAVNAAPVFADIASLDEPVITAETVKPLLTERTRAIVVMHYGGAPAVTAELLDLCHDRGIVLLEDAAHAVGAVYGPAAPPILQRRAVGGAGVMACFSFFSNKNLATGEGGMITTNDDDLAARVRLLRSHGMTTMSWDRFSGHARSYDVPVVGFNYRMDDLRAALGRTQLAALMQNNTARRALRSAYVEALGDLKGWTVPNADPERAGAAHLMVVVAPDADTRNRAVEKLTAAGVQTSLHYPSVTSFRAYADRAAQVPCTLEFASRAITLPLWPGLPRAAVTSIAAVLAACA